MRETLATLGFGRNQTECVVLAVSELSTNLVRYGQSGMLTLTEVRYPDKDGIQVEARDQGPGIADLAAAMQDGFSTGGGLGGGLPAVRRLMDEFDISSSLGGTTVIARAWLRR